MKLRPRLSATAATAVLTAAIVGLTATDASAYSYSNSDPTYDTGASGTPRATEAASADITKTLIYDDSTYLYLRVHVRNLYPAEGQEVRMTFYNLVDGYYEKPVSVHARYYTDGDKVATYSKPGSYSNRKAYLTRSDSGNYTRIRIPKKDVGYIPDDMLVKTRVYYTGGSVSDQDYFRY